MIILKYNTLKWKVKYNLTSKVLKKSRLETDFSRCLICQDDLSDDLVCSPTHNEKVLGSVIQRSKCGDAYYPEIYRRIEYLEVEQLNKNNVT